MMTGEDECMLCGQSSIEQQKAKDKYTPPRYHPLGAGYVECANCNRKSCRKCINGLLKRVTNSKEISKQAKENDKTIKAIRKMAEIIDNPPFERTIDFATCCCFKNSICKTATTTHTKVQMPPTSKEMREIIKECTAIQNNHHDYQDEEFINNGYDSDEYDEDYADTYYDNNKTRLEGIAITRRTIGRNKIVSSTTNDLHLYFDDPTEYNAIHKLQWQKPSKHLSTINKIFKKHQKNKIKSSNIFEGALLIASFGLLVISEVTYQMNVDHMNLAQSKVDGTPKVGHCVIAKSSADAAHDHMTKNNVTRKEMNVLEREVMELEQPSPEDATKYRSVKVEVITIGQTCSEDEALKYVGRGNNQFGEEFLMKQSTFSSNDIVTTDADYVVIMGRFTKEKNASLIPDKLLILRPTNMVTNVLYNNTQRKTLNKQIYNTIRAIAGRGGSELRRVGGSSGTISDETDLDLLAVLHQFKGLVPRHLYAAGIIRDPKKNRYHIVYTKPFTPKGKNKYGLTYYTPARDGGKFVMHPALSATYFPLVDLSYNKMMAVLLVEEINRKFVESGRRALATGPISCEMNSIAIARKAYKDSPTEIAMHNLIVAFNSLNHFSMVAYPVGYHYDHYYDETREYLENKSNFMFKMNNKSIGRGGSLVGGMYVYALLDWK